MPTHGKRRQRTELERPRYLDGRSAEKEGMLWDSKMSRWVIPGTSPLLYWDLTQWRAGRRPGERPGNATNQSTEKAKVANRLYPGRLPKVTHGRYAGKYYTLEERERINRVFIPETVTITETLTINPFDFDTWRRGTPRPDAVKKNRVVVNDTADRMEARELEVLELLESILHRYWPNGVIEDHCKGIQDGADYAIVVDDEVVAMIDSKSANIVTWFQRERAFQCEKAGVQYWIVDPVAKKAMQITKDCTFLPTQFRVYPPQSAA